MDPKPYIEYGDFPKLTPFSEATIRVAVSRGELEEGVHYFKRGRRVIFKWAAIEAWIEKRIVEESGAPADIAPVRRRA